MIKTFTQNDLLRYIYGEMDEKESREMQNLLLFDDELAESYYELLSIKNQSENLELIPSERVVNNILNYSKTFNSHTY